MIFKVQGMGEGVQRERRIGIFTQEEQPDSMEKNIKNTVRG